VLRLPAPAALNGDQLSAELLAAGAPSDVGLSGDDLLVFDASEAQEQTVASVVAVHTPSSAPAPDPDADLAARIQAVHDDPNVSSGVKKLTAALLGLNGEAAVAGRPTDNR
jgi:hypothetical protein